MYVGILQGNSTIVFYPRLCFYKLYAQKICFLTDSNRLLFVFSESITVQVVKYVFAPPLWCETAVPVSPYLWGGPPKLRALAPAFPNAAWSKYSFSQASLMLRFSIFAFITDVLQWNFTYAPVHNSSKRCLHFKNLKKKRAISKLLRFTATFVTMNPLTASKYTASSTLGTPIDSFDRRCVYKEGRSLQRTRTKHLIFTITHKVFTVSPADCSAPALLQYSSLLH